MFCRDSVTTRTTLTDRQRQHDERRGADREVDGALVVERTGREVGANHQATRSACGRDPARRRGRAAGRRRPAPGLSDQLGAGGDPVAQRHPVAQTSSVSTLTPQPLLDLPARPVGARRRPGVAAPASTTRENARAAEAVFVIHRGLVDEVAEIGGRRVVGLTVAEEDDPSRSRTTTIVAYPGAV